MKSENFRSEDFYAALTSTAALDDKFASLQRLAEAYDLPFIFYARRLQPLDPAPACFSTKLVFQKWSYEWAEIYAHERYHLHDFCLHDGVTKSLPYRFEPPGQLTGAQLRFFNHALDHRQMNGFGVPLHGPGANFAGFSASGGEKTASDAAMAALTGAVYAFHAHLSGHLAGQRLQEIDLSPLDMIRLLYLRDGRTARDIAAVQGVSEDAIHKCLQRMRDRLAVKTNAALIFKANLLGLFD